MPVSLIPVATSNFRIGRAAGLTPAAVVLHRSGGSREALRARFSDPAAQTSAHYIVSRGGDVDPCVPEDDTAFHAGLAVNPTWRLIRPRINPNYYTIGIELEGGRTDDWPLAQLTAVAVLIAGVASRWDIPLDGDHVITHSTIRASSTCPAASCPVARIIELARTHSLDTRVPNQMVVRTLSRTNLRHGAPHLRAPIVRVIDAGTDIVVSTFTDTGERVSGNPSWYGTADRRYFWAGATDVPQPTDDPVLSAVPEIEHTTDPMEPASPSPPPIAPPVAPPAIADAAPPINRTRFVLAAQEYYPNVVPKDLVVLHFTAGTTAQSAFDTWRRDPAHIGTAYLVDVDGTIYEVFPPGAWAAHLGVKGTQNLHDRRSIGIEIANVGPLKVSSEDASVLNWWPRRAPDAPDFSTRFCRLDETHRYVAADFRGMKHFAAYRDAQVDAVGALVRHLCRAFSIPQQLPPLARRYTCDLNRFTSYKGVCTHANFRQDKWDIGPAFQWDRLGL